MEESKAQRAEEGEGVSMRLAGSQTLKSTLLICCWPSHPLGYFRVLFEAVYRLAQKWKKTAFWLLRYTFFIRHYDPSLSTACEGNSFGCFSPLSWCTAWLAEVFLLIGMFVLICHSFIG